MTPVIHRQRPRWPKWVVAGLLLLWVLSLWRAQVDAGEVEMLPPLHLILFVLWLMFLDREQSLMLVDHVLVFRDGLVAQRVPLAMAEIKAPKKGWQIRWPEGRIWRRLTFVTPPAFLEAVERAAEAARSADPSTVPRTPAEAAGAVVLASLPRPNLRNGLVIVGILGLFVFAVWLQQPLVLLPLPAIALFSDRIVQRHGDVVLAGEHLWLISPSQEIHPIPLRAVRGIRPAYRSKRELWIETDDPAHPIVRVHLKLGEEPFEKHLRRRLAGEPPVPPRRLPETVVPARPEGILRCSLCGRPEPGATAGSGVFICERCSARARHEANEAGHGLTGKEPKPI